MKGFSGVTVGFGISSSVSSGKQSPITNPEKDSSKLKASIVNVFLHPFVNVISPFTSSISPPSTKVAPPKDIFLKVITSFIRVLKK